MTGSVTTATMLVMQLGEDAERELLEEIVLVGLGVLIGGEVE